MQTRCQHDEVSLSRISLANLTQVVADYSGSIPI